jgi:GDP-4-dehydro-6-deoxy-D-mannose reductase
MKYIVTGANGFIATHLINFLLEMGHEVLGTSRKVDVKKINKNLKIHIGEISQLESEILSFKPDVVFHLAAQSSPELSLSNPSLTFEVNTMGTITLLEVLQKLENQPRIVLASTSAVYSSSVEGRPIKENFKINPLTAYGVSKYCMEQIAQIFIKQKNMDIIIVRPFFLIGPRKNDDVCSAFAKSVVEIELGNKTELEVGNLNITRDFLDIVDGVKAFYTVSISGVTGEAYNISSGKGFTLRELLNIFIKNTESEIIEIIEKKYIRHIDDIVRIGDPGKLNKLGWNSNTNIEKSIKEILDYWRSENKKN